MLIYCLLVTLGLLAGVQCKRCTENTVHVEFPRAVPPGGSATLLCHYNVSDEPLHSVKWFKGEDEFFRYTVGDNPQLKVYLTKGIDIDLSKTTASKVVLKHVGVETNGKYTCEVSYVVPNISIVRDSGDFHIITLPEGELVVNVDNNYVGYREMIQAVCIVPPSYPPANITWFINGEQVHSGFSHPKQHKNKNTPASTTSFITLRMHFNSFISDKANVTCVAKISDLYKQQKTIIIERNPNSEHYRYETMNGATSAKVGFIPIALLLGALWYQY